jgi:hypothetical protein
MYADDGVLLMEDIETYEKIWDDPLLEWCNAERNKQKSGWVKVAGKWKRTLKFVGLEYNGETNKIRSAVRDAPPGEWKTLEELSQILGEDGIYYGWEKYPEDWVELLSSNVAGWIQARMWDGKKWDEVESRMFKYLSGSTIDKLKARKKTLYNANSLSCQRIAKLFKRNKITKSKKPVRAKNR